MTLLPCSPLLCHHFDELRMGGFPLVPRLYDSFCCPLLFSCIILTYLCPSVYTVPIQVGSNNQNFSLQVDTGSSDLVRSYPIRAPLTLTIFQWIASTSCSTTACAGTKGRQYDPSISGIATQSNFSIQYLAGNVSGPIYWDEVQFGGYTIGDQALGTAPLTLHPPLLLTHTHSGCDKHPIRTPRARIQRHPWPRPSLKLPYCALHHSRDRKWPRRCSIYLQSIWHHDCRVRTLGPFSFVYPVAAWV